MTGRCFEGLVHKADFERLLASPTRSRSAHFAVHHLLSGPSGPQRVQSVPTARELSTDEQQASTRSVDNYLVGCWLGTVIPKRHARRAVTRNLLRRQIRAAMLRHVDRLPKGLWLVRLRMSFATQQFPAAASQALCRQAAGELDQLLTRA